MVSGETRVLHTVLKVTAWNAGEIKFQCHWVTKERTQLMNCDTA